VRVELLNITPDAEQFISQCSAICYDADTNDEAKNDRRIKHLMSVKHLATLRFAHATFRVSGISRACSHQFVRSKHLDFLQRSQRYCSEKEAEYVTPDALLNSTGYREAMNNAWKHYGDLLQSGVRKEDARMVLPNATTTELVVTGNLHAWKDFIALRTTPAAQSEIRYVAKDIQNILRLECPNIFGLTNGEVTTL